jgi:hypothetical protein
VDRKAFQRVQNAAAVRAAGAQHRHPPAWKWLTFSSVDVSFVCMCRKEIQTPGIAGLNLPLIKWHICGLFEWKIEKVTRSVRGVSTATVSQTDGIPVSERRHAEPAENSMYKSRSLFYKLALCSCLVLHVIE